MKFEAGDIAAASATSAKTAFILIHPASTFRRPHWQAVPSLEEG
jgi:hypothetical protein